MKSSVSWQSRPPAKLCQLIALVALVQLGLFAQAGPTQAASQSKQSREMQAREAFATGRYKEALELFGKLYAEKLHPTYLRNIGRCYQKMKEPDKAIDSFRDYLRKVKEITAAERDEIDSYISEMEDLKRRQAADEARAQPAKPTAATETTIPPVPAIQPTAPAAHADLVSSSVPPAPEPTPFYKRGWVWGVAAGVVAVGVVGGLYAAGVFSKSSDPCAGRVCLGGP
jgi:hypothetical protein